MTYSVRAGAGQGAWRVELLCTAPPSGRRSQSAASNKYYYRQSSQRMPQGMPLQPASRCDNFTFPDLSIKFLLDLQVLPSAANYKPFLQATWERGSRQSWRLPCRSPSRLPLMTGRVMLLSKQGGLLFTTSPPTWPARRRGVRFGSDVLGTVHINLQHAHISTTCTPPRGNVCIMRISGHAVCHTAVLRR